MRDLKAEKASTDPTHYPDRLRPWARPIGLRSTNLTHLYTHTQAGYGLVYLGMQCVFVPSRASRLQLRSRPGLPSWGCAAGLEVEIAGCLTVGLSDWRIGKLVRLCLSVATAGYHSGTP